MARDYVKRSKPATKPGKKAAKKPSSGRATKKSAASSSKLPVIAGVTVLLVIVAFVLFLNNIKDNVDESTIPNDSAQALPALVQPVQVLPDTSELPPKPQERDYINDLENRVVQIDLPEVDNKPTRPYLMQCGSFRNRSDAESLKAQIAFQGMEAMVKTSKGKNGTWYKVVQGPFATKRKAEAARHKLGRGKIRGCGIWFW